MNSGNIFALDLGTSGLKAALFTPELGLIGSATADVPSHMPRAGWVEQAPEDWWRAAADTAQQLARAHPEAMRRVVAVSTSAHMMGQVPVDATGRVLLDRVPIWADARADGQRRAFLDRFGGYDRFYRIVRQGMEPELYSLFKILWMRDHLPDVFARTKHFLQSKEYLGLRMTGEMATEPSDYACTLTSDVAARQPSREILECAGLDGARFPPLRRSRDLLGTLTREAAQTLALPEGAAVYIGLGDAVAAAVGALANAPGQAYFYIGSSAWTGFIERAPLDDAESRINVLPHLDPALYQLQYVMNTGGAAHKWIVNTLYGTQDYALAEREAAAVPAHERTLLCLPALQPGGAPFNNIDARGVFFGATLNHGRGHFVRAVLDGLALNLRLLADNVTARRGGQRLQSALLVGGGTKSNLLMQTIADTLQCEVRVSPFQQIANCLGAAICAAIGHGMLASPAEAQPPAADARVFAPDARLAADSVARAHLYRSIHDRLRPAFADLAALRALSHDHVA